ncbi:MAG TPA: type II toxin-antitoxin system VapC family toxin [Pirellulales bacterium]|nr:type II toxin-antitoxin system VapC family toxin [Pirellulales bacterium]
MKPRVYVETTIVSYLTAWVSRDLVMAANQETTRQWWTERKEHFELYVSQAVIEEATGGDKEAAQRRLEIIEEISILSITDEVKALAKLLVAQVPLAQRAQVDALHIAASAVHGMDYLLTWNCSHIANATLRPKIESICRANGYEPPVICTPQELMETDHGIS